MLIALIVVAACTTEDGTPDMPDTLGSGTLSFVDWSGGLCMRGFTCAGTLDLRSNGFTAGFDTEVVARGHLAQATTDTLDDFVAAIPLSEPTGVFVPDGLDGGMVELRVERSGETRTYFTNGFRGDFGAYVYSMIDAIATCQPDIATYDSCTPQR